MGLLGLLIVFGLLYGILVLAFPTMPTWAAVPSAIVLAWVIKLDAEFHQLVVTMKKIASSGGGHHPTDREE